MESQCKGPPSTQPIQRIRNSARSLASPKQSRKPFSSVRTVKSARCCTSSQDAASARMKVDVHYFLAVVRVISVGRTTINSLTAEQRRYEQQRQGVCHWLSHLQPEVTPNCDCCCRSYVSICTLASTGTDFTRCHPSSGSSRAFVRQVGRLSALIKSFLTAAPVSAALYQLDLHAGRKQLSTSLNATQIQWQMYLISHYRSSPKLAPIIAQQQHYMHLQPG